MHAGSSIGVLANMALGRTNRMHFPDQGGTKRLTFDTLSVKSLERGFENGVFRSILLLRSHSQGKLHQCQILIQFAFQFQLENFRAALL